MSVDPKETLARAWKWLAIGGALFILAALFALALCQAKAHGAEADPAIARPEPRPASPLAEVVALAPDSASAASVDPHDPEMLPFTQAWRDEYKALLAQERELQAAVNGHLETLKSVRDAIGMMEANRLRAERLLQARRSQAEAKRPYHGLPPEQKAKPRGDELILWEPYGEVITAPKERP